MAVVCGQSNRCRCGAAHSPPWPPFGGPCITVPPSLADPCPIQGLACNLHIPERIRLAASIQLSGTFCGPTGPPGLPRREAQQRALRIGIYPMDEHYPIHSPRIEPAPSGGRALSAYCCQSPQNRANGTRHCRKHRDAWAPVCPISCGHPWPALSVSKIHYVRPTGAGNASRFRGAVCLTSSTSTHAPLPRPVSSSCTAGLQP